MILKIRVKLKLPSALQTYNLGSTLHGVLIEQLSKPMADSLHQLSQYSPLKQRLFKENGRSIWEIICFDDDLAVEITAIFKNNETIHLAYHDIDLDISEYTLETIEVEALLKNQSGHMHPSKYMKLSICTPTSFKSQGSYDIFPDMKKFFRSIMMTFDTFFSEYKLFDDETLDYLVQHVKIIDYSLRSTKFHLEGVTIPSFIGKFTLKISGPTPLVNLLAFMLEFGEYSGVGIKTSLGMGKFKVE